VRRVLDALARVIGVPEPVEIERKYLVSRVGDIPVPHETVEIEQVYLQTSDNNHARIRKRGQRGAFTYFHTLKRPLSAGQRIEEERQISPREYANYLVSADPKRHPIKKTRTCFLWNSQYYELDRFTHPNPGLMLLEAELDTISQPVIIPPWVSVVREVTDDPQYSNAALAKIT
jgi:CYTH domain-containing protein